MRAAEDAGLAELWLWEDCFLEGGIATAAMALAWSDRLKIGIGLLPVPLRNAAVTAMELATLERAFPGRLHVCLGPGVLDWMGQVGARPKSPLTAVREHVDAIRRLLAGETVTTTGDYVQLDQVALDWPPERVPPILVGASGPKMIELAGDIADGTLLTVLTTPDRMGWVAERNDAHRIVNYVLLARGPWTHEQARPDVPSGDPADIVVSGEPADIALAVREYADAGADTVVFQPLPDDTDVEGFIRFVASDLSGAVCSLYENSSQ